MFGIKNFKNKKNNLNANKKEENLEILSEAKSKEQADLELLKAMETRANRGKTDVLKNSESIKQAKEISEALKIQNPFVGE